MADLLEAIRSERATKRKPTRAAAFALTFISPPGTAQFYLGQRRRAWLWAFAVPVAYAMYVLLLVGVPLRWAYGSFVCVAVIFFFGWRAAALIDVFLVPSERFQRLGALKVVGFFALSLALTVAITLLTRAYVAEAFKIPSGSMIPTLLLNDDVLVAKGRFHARAPRRGEVAVFVSPDHPDQDYVKRVIGLPGDTVTVKRGHPWINGREVPHCKVAPAQPPGAEGPGETEVEILDGRAYLVYFESDRDVGLDEGPWRVAPSEVFVLGDNRNNSLDSRRFFEGRGGGVPFRNLKGPPLFIWLAFGGAGEVTWDRLGMPVDEIHLPEAMKSLDSAVRACLSAHAKELLPAK